MKMMSHAHPHVIEIKVYSFPSSLEHMWAWTTKPVIRVFFFIEIYSSKSWINKLSIDVCFVGIGQYWQYWLKYNYLKIWNLRVQKKKKYWENRL